MAGGFRDLLMLLLGWRSAPWRPSYLTVRIGETTQVSLLNPPRGTIGFYWYFDGAYVGKTVGPTKSFHVPAGEQLRLDVIPTADENFDPIASAPDGFPSRRTLWWIRSLGVDAANYRIDQREGAGDWTTVALIPQEADRWDFLIITDRLKDLTEYTWRVVALDAAGNEADPVAIGPELIVRTPDAPNFTAEFDSETRAVAFADANP